MFRYNNEFKDSKVEYIGKIPKSWKIIRNKHIFNKTKVIAGPNWDKYNILSLTKNGVIIKDIERNEGKMPSDFSIYQIVNPGNLLMCLFDIDVTPRCVGYIENNGIISAAYTELSPIADINMKYYYWWYLMLDIDKQLLHLSKNLRNSLSTEDFMALSVVKPPLDEQIQIANYLDKKTAKIDETIAKNKELIDLLEEKRIALINHVVTKGLDPDVPMKDSGIEWIGNIPEHWETIKLKNCTTIVNDKKDLANEKDKYIGLEHIESETGNLLNYSNEGADGTVNKFKKNMILFGKLRPYLAKVVNAPFDGVCSTELLVFKTSKSLVSKYLFYFMLSNRFIEQVNSSTYGVKMPRASPDFINSLHITLPNSIDQQEIVDYLDSKITNINYTISKIKENIILLEEYKTSLIHHVVTGKIDVKEEVI